VFNFNYSAIESDVYNDGNNLSVEISCGCGRAPPPAVTARAEHSSHVMNFLMARTSLIRPTSALTNWQIDGKTVLLLGKNVSVNDAVRPRYFTAISLSPTEDDVSERVSE